VTSLEQRFHFLLSKWKCDTGHLSATREQHSAYQEIIKLGDPVVLVILRHIKETSEHFFIALSEITGENPVKPEHRGYLQLMTEDWLEWGRSNGYIV
jgi:hypothetical protein